ncbi:hypothetical protein RF11_11466 [Thelohanellus kitauei]|uniref:Integrase catalytic domain-containing protein n=1 Tax=Thelohanellus kitauei TaxID=669202 RepID=A0A0C2JLE1_THEKT|nr:hypothetical protein RF11_11466 [Thelohanellus kitauei]
MKIISAQTIQGPFISNWIARLGIPIDITFDSRAQFASALWSMFAELLGTQLHHTTAYHPQSNLLVERFHRHLKSATRARLAGPNCSDELPCVLFDVRTSVKEDIGCSSS